MKLKDIKELGFGTYVYRKYLEYTHIPLSPRSKLGKDAISTIRRLNRERSLEKAEDVLRKKYNMSFRFDNLYYKGNDLKTADVSVWGQARLCEISYGEDGIASAYIDSKGNIISVYLKKPCQRMEPLMGSSAGYERIIKLDKMGFLALLDKGLKEDIKLNEYEMAETKRRTETDRILIGEFANMRKNLEETRR